MNIGNHLWGLRDRPDLKWLNTVSRTFREAGLADRHALPDLRRGKSLLVGSDYSGQHKTSAYEAMSFLIADPSDSVRWHAAQSIIRDVLMPDARRFGFKHMNDRIRLGVLPRFLSAADTISGLLLVVLIHKSVGRLFCPSVDPALLDQTLMPITTWPQSVLERALGACHFVSILLAGLSRAGQDIMWISDADDIVANENRLRQFVALFGAVSSQYLSHDLGHMRIGTTASDTGKRDVEDFVAIADLAAGAICDTLNVHERSGIAVPTGVIAPLPPAIKATTHQLMAWWATEGVPLKRFALKIERGSTPSKLLIGRLAFPAIPKFL